MIRNGKDIVNKITTAQRYIDDVIESVGRDVEMKINHPGSWVGLEIKDSDIRYSIEVLKEIKTKIDLLESLIKTKPIKREESIDSILKEPPKDKK